MKDVSVAIICSPPRIKRLVSSRIFDDDDGNRCSKTGIMDSRFNHNERLNIQCDHVSGRGKGRGGSTLCLPLSCEQEVDEEACIGGGCYYNMNGTNEISSNVLSYEERDEINAREGCDSSSTDMFRRCYPFPFIGMCLLFLFGIGEMLRKIGGNHGGVD
mmetsp:Transcript_26889/g.42169  ORF Transcript_26889/g.42169 Transcript_26889/m.42169 type:complete len:159 (-) Transcript_26889:940-1416(-)